MPTARWRRRSSPSRLRVAPRAATRFPTTSCAACSPWRAGRSAPVPASARAAGVTKQRRGHGVDRASATLREPMSKTLVIAEKPSVGRDLARVLPGPSGKQEGYLEGPDHVITWAVGHLVQLAEPDEYDAK